MNWTEHRNPEGRTYWYNPNSKESVWEKPEELKTPFERALTKTTWREYFSGGRKYYYNTSTKESKWDMPDELLNLLENIEKDATAANVVPGQPLAIGQGPQGALVPLGGLDPSSSNLQLAGMNQDMAVGMHTGGLPFNAQSGVLPTRPNLPDDPVIPHNGFLTVEEGEKAFFHLLRKAGVDANWTWDQTMRAIITDPLYKALNTLAEKKAAWQKYTENLKTKEHEEREARLSKLRPAIRNMLKGNPSVHHYTTFPTADRLFAQHPIWQHAKFEAERRLIFEEHVSELKQREMQESRAARSRSVSKIVSLFKELQVDVVTKWRTAHSLVLESETWNSDSELQNLPTLDILLAFEDYSRVKEREFDEHMRRAQVEKNRKERKAREAFKDLLNELVNDGKIKPGTKWKHIYSSVAYDERYTNILGNPGSNPLELFWDVVDGLDQKLEAKVAVAEEAIKRYNEQFMVEDGASAEAFVFKVGPDTSEEAFLQILKADNNPGVKNLGEEEMKEIFRSMHETVLKQHADEKRRAERKLRHLQDDLRYALKKLPEPLDVNLSYEEAVPLFEHLPEFKALEDDEARRASFFKFMKRQKERLRERETSEDGGSTASRKRKEPARDRDTERDHDKDDVRRKDRDHDKDVGRPSKHHRGYDDYDSHGHRSSRDHRDRDYGRDRERDKDYYGKEKDRDHGYRSSKHHRDYERDDRRSSRRADGGYKDWDDVRETVPYKEDREKSASIYKEESGGKRDRAPEERLHDERSEKRARYEPVPVPEGEPPRTAPGAAREDTPEEGEI